MAARFVHNDRLVDALTQQAFTAIRISPVPEPSTIASSPVVSSTTRHCGRHV
ncbi:hypothetical protein [Nocardia xishanensis]|uniref:Uncharacterized protein n=1 Tax=Nocardia xishanensis TaxID=238964 RepID=A0ABW7XC07_9NOCA